MTPRSIAEFPGSMAPRWAATASNWRSCRGARRACAASIPKPPQGAQPTCETDGVLAPVTATIAALQVGRCAENSGARARTR